MVITIEPGIYIPIGSCDKKMVGNSAVWIEDDILITPESFSTRQENVQRKKGNRRTYD
jgi:Xaa-Pro aminopeptidase